MCLTPLRPSHSNAEKESQAANPAAIHAYERRDCHLWCERRVQDRHVSDIFDFYEDITERP